MNRKVVAFCVSLLPLMISSGMVYSILPIYLAKDLGASEFYVGTLFTIGAMTGVLTSVAIGKISDRMGRKGLITTAQLAFAIAMLFYSTIPRYTYAIPLHVLEGFAWATIGTLAPAYIADLSRREERGEAMGIYNTVWSLGWTIGPVLGGALAELFGFRTMLKLVFLLIIFGTLLSTFFVD